MTKNHYRWFLCFLFCLSVLFYVQSTAAEEPGYSKEKSPVMKSFVPVTIRNDFSCEVPADWSKDGPSFGLSQEEKKVYGLILQGPYRGETPVKISMHYYAEENLIYKSIDHYLRVFSQSALGVALEGSSYGSITPVKVGGRDAKMFERIKKEYVPVNNTISSIDKPVKDDPRVYERQEMMARPMSVKERFVVLPAEKGFYSLRYTAPAEKFQEFLPVFEKVTASFRAIR